MKLKKPTPPTEPKKPLRTFVKKRNISINVNSYDNLAELIAKIPADIPHEMVKTQEDGDYDYSYTYLVYQRSETITLTDSQWTAALQRYDVALEKYKEKWDEYKVKLSKYVEDQQTIEQQERTLLAQLEKKYKDSV